MIELPHEFLNVLFALLIISAGFSRSRRRSGWKATLAPIHRIPRLARTKSRIIERSVRGSREQKNRPASPGLALSPAQDLRGG